MPEAREIIIGKERLKCGERIGGGNEGDAYRIVGKPNLAVKIYKKDKRRNREGKIRAMVSVQVGQKTSLVAFPLSTVTSLTGEFLGFSMRLMSDRYELHQLYSPISRLRYFPSADYRFVVRAALNVARAVGAMHNLQRCVIGDLNHSSILVAQDATVVLIDADSIQFKMNGKTYPCVVGVPDFTPPELHGKPFASFDRTIAHDNFGLAVAIFHLLFMGRHPFAGRYEGPYVSIGEAIAQNRFAYSIERRAETKILPPTDALTLDQFPDYISRKFEDAFGLAHSARPNARRWMESLTMLESSLGQCSKVRTHYSPKTSNMRPNLATRFKSNLKGILYRGIPTDCVWCKLSDKSGFDMFPVSSTVASSSPNNLCGNGGNFSETNNTDRMPRKVVETPSVFRKEKVTRENSGELTTEAAVKSKNDSSVWIGCIVVLVLAIVIFLIGFVLTGSWELGVAFVVVMFGLITWLGVRIH